MDKFTKLYETHFIPCQCTGTGSLTCNSCNTKLLYLKQIRKSVNILTSFKIYSYFSNINNKSGIWNNSTIDEEEIYCELDLWHKDVKTAIKGKTVTDGHQFPCVHPIGTAHVYVIPYIYLIYI